MNTTTAEQRRAEIESLHWNWWHASLVAVYLGAWFVAIAALVALH